MTPEQTMLGYKRTGDKKWVEVWGSGAECDISGTHLAAVLEIDYQLDEVKSAIINATPKHIRLLFGMENNK